MAAPLQDPVTPEQSDIDPISEPDENASFPAGLEQSLPGSSNETVLYDPGLPASQLAGRNRRVMSARPFLQVGSYFVTKALPIKIRCKAYTHPPSQWWGSY